MTISFKLPLLTAGLALGLLGMHGCTKNPPGPTYDGSSGTTSGANADGKTFAAYDQLKWSDDFDGTSLDATKWNYEVRDVWFNNELQATTNSRDNVNVTGGYLNITARKQVYNGRQYTSGRIMTKGKMDFGFGRLDVKAKLPKGKGIWPAIWMLGSNDATATWPACGEIDIMELKGSQPATNLSTIHYGASVAQHQYKSGSTTLASGDFSDDFHVFSLVRSSGKMEFYVDGKIYQAFTTGDASPYPFNNPFYAILNVAVGGDFDGNPDGSTTFPQTMQVDYVRFYQYNQ